MCNLRAMGPVIKSDVMYQILYTSDYFFESVIWFHIFDLLLSSLESLLSGTDVCANLLRGSFFLEVYNPFSFIFYPPLLFLDSVSLCNPVWPKI